MIHEIRKTGGTPDFPLKSQSKYSGKNMKTIIILSAAIMAGCATTTGPGDSIIEVDTGYATRCKYVGEISGSSSWSGLAAEHGVENAKKEAMNKAAAMGASHASFHSVMATYGVKIAGKAYTCD